MHPEPCFPNARPHQLQVTGRYERGQRTEDAVDAIRDGLVWLELDWEGEAVSQFARADRHGAVVIRPEHTQQLPQAIDDVMRNEAPILEAARAEGFDLATLLQLWSDKDDVH